MSLNQSNPDITQPLATTYDQAQCAIGVVHVGYGAFHRAHQAVYIDDYMQRSGDLRWGIAAVNLRPSETLAFQSAQAEKDGYLLKTTNSEGQREFRLVRPHCAFADWSSQPEDAEALISQRNVHVVTITVTESGYYLKDDWSLNLHHPVILAELTGKASVSVYAFLYQSLQRRLAENGQPLNILCCDNIRSNGRMLQANFLNYLEHLGEINLRNWVADNVAFPCSMVDRITPRSSDNLRKEIADLFPHKQNNAIQAESFKQWVLEDSFKAPMPNLTLSGVEIVSDVDPYEEAKIRILNGGHTALCYLGVLAGHTTFDQAFKDPKLRAVFDGFEIGEVLPGLDMELPFDKRAYLAEIAARFSNEVIADQLERICMDGYSKMPIYILPSITACFQQNIVPRHAIHCIASWYVYARRYANGEIPIHYHEPYWDQLNPLLAKGAEESFARTKELWANVPDDYPQFVTELVAAIQEMELKWPA
ncbi:mannitol dehydrogenase family protein [Maritalea sp.]|uniref:mannitol dehydrogenase family protein n=1 Tax=Maritalea sp. TaxID=2003361 RepID=UPI003EF8422F